MTRPLDDTGSGTPGKARATFKVLCEPRESRRIEFLSASEFLVVRLMDGREVWRTLSGQKPVGDSMCEWVRDA